MPILGECPYEGCHEPLPFYDPPDGGSAYLPTNCEACGRKYWSWLSRIDPWSMTEADFLAEFEPDHEKGTVRRKALSPDRPELIDPSGALNVICHRCHASIEEWNDGGLETVPVPGGVMDIPVCAYCAPDAEHAP